MKKYTFPTMSIVLATAAVGIATVTAPVQASTAGLAGSTCAAIKGNEAKLAVQNNGAVYNKNTAGSAGINCAIPLEYNLSTSVYLTYIKRDTGTLSCTFHRRSFDYLSGATSSQSVSTAGSSNLFFNATADYFNSVQCSIPKAGGTAGNTQNGVNGVLWQN